MPTHCSDPAADVTADDLRARIDGELETFLARQGDYLAAISDELGPIVANLARFILDGGKRLRPVFAYWGWRGAGGGDDQRIVAAASALEWVQTCALIHDDVMDRSQTRRGRPAMHMHFQKWHSEQDGRGDAEAFGVAIAILLGDFSLIWADEMLRASGLSDAELLRAWPFYDEMRTEVMAGQYLDLAAQAFGEHSLRRSLKVVRYKSGKYTIERPLHIGAAMAGASPELLRAFSDYGLPLGEAFQLRDDVLGVFGDERQTGKPAGDDLREGKRTALVAATVERCSPAQRAVIDAGLGNADLDDDGLAAMRAVIVETGALQHVEKMIEQLAGEAALAVNRQEMTSEARAALLALTAATTKRDV